MVEIGVRLGSWLIGDYWVVRYRLGLGARFVRELILTYFWAGLDWLVNLVGWRLMDSLRVGELDFGLLAIGWRDWVG